MHIRGVELPESLIAAQKAGRLVIFAGAGVSIPAPSNYPDFSELADKVAAGVLDRDPSDEPIDHFLGRLTDKGIKVHERVREILSDSSSVPNALHLNILRLFESENSVRLVTTNFDNHFTTAASQIFSGKCPEQYFAPALPVGDSFEGIVYLHGSVKKSVDRLVLTDTDFGRAYLTRGWATTFLQRLFSKYVVLFVGFSHDDVVMEYLARGLSPESGHPGRFALDVERNNNKWLYRGITPIYFAKVSEKSCYDALGPIIKDWAEDARRTPLEHEDKIKSILERPLSLDIAELDYVEASLQDIARARFFCRFAKRTDWLKWVEEKVAFSRLFLSADGVTEIDQELARWFAENFVCTNTNAGLAAVLRKNQTLGPLLASSISRHLVSAKPPASAEIIGKWLPLLTGSPHSGSRDQFLPHLFDRCHLPEADTVVLILFEHLTKPEILLKKNTWRELTDGVEDVDFTLHTKGETYWLKHYWEKLFKPHLDVLGSRLIWIVTNNLLRAHSLLRAGSLTDRQLDRLSLARGMVESDSQGSPDNGTETLIGAAVDLVQWVITSAPNSFDFLVESWSSSGSELLLRLALFGLAESTAWDDDRKLAWIRERDLVYRYGLKHELFLAIRSAYPRASDEARQAFLDYIVKKGRTTERDYEIYNLLHWLSAAAPECKLVSAPLGEIITKHPEYRPREHPDMDSWVGGVVSGWGQSPISLDEIRKKSADEIVEIVAGFKDKDDPFSTTREGLIETIREAASTSYELSMALLQSMRVKDIWMSDLFEAIVAAWKQMGPDHQQWNEILSFLKSNAHVLESSIYAVPHLLEDGTKGSSHDIPVSLIPLAKSVGREIWSASNRIARRREDAENWLFVAINDPSGNLLTFWLRALSKVKQEMGDAWKGLPREEIEFLTSVVSGDSYSAELGRVLIASQINFLMALDEGWTVEKVVPLFDFTKDKRRASQAWSGYLMWGRWNDGLLTYMLPHYVQAFPFLNGTFKERQHRQSFCNHLAGIAALSKINPVSSGWLYQFLQNVTEEERVMWAASFDNALGHVDVKGVRTLWSNWLRQYWDNRIQGVPIPLSAKESEEMVDWIIHLSSVLSEVVERITRSPAPDMTDSFLFRKIQDSALPASNPNEISELMLFLLKHSANLPWDIDWIESLVATLSRGPKQSTYMPLICNELARLGYRGADQLPGAGAHASGN